MFTSKPKIESKSTSSTTIIKKKYILKDLDELEKSDKIMHTIGYLENIVNRNYLSKMIL